MLQPIVPHRSTGQLINLFFALKPGQAAADRAHTTARRHFADRGMTGRVLRRDRLHVTLLSVGGFVGEVPQAAMQRALSIGDAITLPRFEVKLGRAASFPRKAGKRPYVLLGDESIADIALLHCGLVGAMFRQGFDLPQMPRFNAHMTLAYDSKHHDELPVEPIVWRAEEFVLIESLVGQTVHIERGRWPLR